jgi:hypothetical protein
MMAIHNLVMVAVVPVLLSQGGLVSMVLQPKKVSAAISSLTRQF